MGTRGAAIAVSLLALALSGCSTTGRFVIPEGTELEVYRRPVELQEDGTVVTKPFFWTAAGSPPRRGVAYRLFREGEVIKEGRLRDQFLYVRLAGESGGSHDGDTGGDRSEDPAGNPGGDCGGDPGEDLSGDRGEDGDRDRSKGSSKERGRDRGGDPGRDRDGD